MALKIFGNYGNEKKSEEPTPHDKQDESVDTGEKQRLKDPSEKTTTFTNDHVDSEKENNLTNENMGVHPKKDVSMNTVDENRSNISPPMNLSSNSSSESQSKMFTTKEIPLFREALELINSGKLREAEAAFHHLGRVSNRRSAYVFGEAFASAKLGRIEKAVGLLRDLLAGDPDHEGAVALLKQLGEIYTPEEDKTDIPVKTEEQTSSTQMPAAKLNPSDLNKLYELIIKAGDYMNKGKVNEAFQLVIKAKGFQHPVLGLDFLRARCFMEMKQVDSAIQALKEELRAFPENNKAIDMLNDLKAAQSPVEESFEADSEFMELFEIIKEHTMLSKKRLFNLYLLAKEICEKNIPGNFVECGVAAGGSTALLGMVIKRHTKMPRLLYAFDSFEGMPEPDENDTHAGIVADDTGWGKGTCSASEESVKALMQQLDLTSIVITVKGYFESTLPMMRDFAGMISLLHMDGDWYGSTKTIINNFYEHVVRNGAVQIDDYGFWEGCKKAVHEYEREKGLSFILHPIDYTGVYLKKTVSFPINKDIPQNIVDAFYEDDIGKTGIMSQMSENERFQLYYIMLNLLPQKTSSIRFLEIGSFSGASLLLTYNALKRKNADFYGITVEPALHPQFKGVLQKIGDKVTHIKDFSDNAVEKVNECISDLGGEFDLIFVDGDHTYEGVAKDIENYFPFLTKQGIIVFHDFLPPLNDKNREAVMFHHGGREPGIREACLKHMDTKSNVSLIDIPLLYPDDPSQTQSFLPIIPDVFSTIRAYKRTDNNEQEI